MLICYLYEFIFHNNILKIKLFYKIIIYLTITSFVI